MKKIKYYFIATVLLICLMINLVSCGCEHFNKEYIETTATCEKSGMATYNCLDCKKTIEITDEAKGHKFTEFISDSSTCTVAGYKTYKCENCEKTNQQSSIALGHSYNGAKCKRCDILKPSFTQMTIKYENGKESVGNGVVDFYTKNSVSSLGFYGCNIDLVTNSTAAKMSLVGQIKSSSMLMVSIVLYDSQNQKIVSKNMLYQLSYNRVFSTDANITLERSVSDGEVVYYEITASLI